MNKIILFILLLAISFLFFGELLFSNKTFVYRDIHLLVYPGKLFATSCIRDGFLPFWNPYILCGSPFMAIPYHQVLYPLSILVYSLPFAFGIDLFFFLHILLAGLFFYLLMRDQGLSSGSSLFASLSYTFSGIFLSTGAIMATTLTATWTPILLLLYLRSLKMQSIKYALLSGLVVAVQFLSGTPDYVCLDLGLLFLLTMNWIVYKKSLFPIKSFVLLVLAGIGLCLFQILPFLEFVFLSDRMGGLSFSEVSLWSLGLYEILNIFIPLGTAIPSDGYILPYIGQKMTTSFYMGILPIILAISAPFWIKRRFVLFWTAAAIFSLCLSAGKYLPIYPFFYKYLPGFSMLRDPVKAMHLFSLSASILAGFGFNRLFSKDITKRLILFLFFYLFLHLLFSHTNILFKIGNGLHLPYRVIIEEVFFWKYFVAGNCLKVSAILLGYSLLFYLIYKAKIQRSLGLSAIIILTIFDLYTFNGRLSYLINEDFYKEEPKIAKNLKNGRFFSPATAKKMVKHIGGKSTLEDFILSKEVLYGNMGMAFGLYNVGGYEGIYLKDFNSLTENIPTRVLLKIMGVQDILLFGDEEIVSYKNQDSVPRPLFVKGKRVIQDRKSILEYMKSSGFDPEKEVILEEEPKEFQNAKCKMQNAKCKIIKYEPNRIVIDVDAPNDGFLFLSDTYYPGWRAYVDGQKTKIYRADYYFRAVQIKEGRHIVEFKYLPKTFIIGLIGSLLSGIMVLVLFLCTEKATVLTKNLLALHGI
ncbi:MAG: YfhO family protein [bacterium]|nr:YfhO family protein [bacterium]